MAKKDYVLVDKDSMLNYVEISQDDYMTRKLYGYVYNFILFVNLYVVRMHDIGRDF